MKLIPIQDQRKAFQYAVEYLTQEIKSIELTLEHCHLLAANIFQLEKRLAELKGDLLTLHSHNLH